MALQGLLATSRRRAALVFAAAFALRLGYAAATTAGRGELVADARDYSSYAQSLIQTGTYRDAAGARADRMPGYPLFLAALFCLFGTSVAAVQAVQCALGAATCVLVLELGSDWLGPGWGLAGGLGAACYFDLFSTSARLLTETLAAFLLTLLFLLYSRRRPARPRDAAAMGLVAGALYLVRPEFSLFALLLAALLLLELWPVSRRRAAACAGALLLGLSLFALPWALRNKAVLGRMVLTSTAGPLNLYLGIPRTAHERFGLLPTAYVPLPALPAMGELAAMDFFRARAVRLCAALSAGQIARALLFNTLIQYYPFHPGYDPTLVFWLPFWLWGAWLCRGERRAWPLAAALLYLTAVYDVVAVMQARHRQVLGPAAILLGLWGLRELRRRLSGPGFRRVLLFWAAANACVWAFAPRVRQAALLLRDLL
ncbi:MAG: glycosyltransferase family 39 protein [Elusimicrobia bacterium]|nr:glycosyltransferase family 39 protein [Elusimicrobiota bacterium]MDE2424490.1 glycosyltransferase family 39 protein [Elusimicrobiota bacterium]